MTESYSVTAAESRSDGNEAGPFLKCHFQLDSIFSCRPHFSDQHWVRKEKREKKKYWHDLMQGAFLGFSGAPYQFQLSKLQICIWERGRGALINNSIATMMEPAKSNHLYFRRRSGFWINFNLRRKFMATYFPRAIRWEKNDDGISLNLLREECRRGEDSWCIQHWMEELRRCEERKIVTIQGDDWRRRRKNFEFRKL